MMELSSEEEEWAALRSNVREAQTLARAILGKNDDDDNAVAGPADLFEAIQTFEQMKEELAQLQRESQLTQKVLVATQCSQTILSQRLQKMSSGGDESKIITTEDEEETVLFSSDSDQEEIDFCWHEEHASERDEDDYEYDEDYDEDSEMDVPQPEDNLEEEIRMILVPSKSKSLGVGLLGEMEHCIVEWHTTFEHLNQEHELQVMACKADLERLHVRIDAMEILHPTGVEAAAAAQRARVQLETLVNIVEAFPTKARVEALQQQLEASKRMEQDSHRALARAIEELEAARQREESLLRQLQLEAESVAHCSAETPVATAEEEEPKTTPRTAPAWLLRIVKNKLRRLFHLDRVAMARRNNQQKFPAAAQVESSHHNSVIDDEEIHLEFGSQTGIMISTPDNSPPPLETDMVLRNVGSSADDLLLVFSSSDHESSELGDVDIVTILNPKGIFSTGNRSPNTSLDGFDDTTTTIRSLATDATTNSSSGTPPSKLAADKKKKEVVVLVEPTTSECNNSIFDMAKKLLWIQ